MSCGDMLLFYILLYLKVIVKGEQGEQEEGVSFPDKYHSRTIDDLKNRGDIQIRELKNTSSAMNLAVLAYKLK